MDGNKTIFDDIAIRTKDTIMNAGKKNNMGNLLYITFARKSFEVDSFNAVFDKGIITFEKNIDTFIAIHISMKLNATIKDIIKTFY